MRIDHTNPTGSRPLARLRLPRLADASSLTDARLLLALLFGLGLTLRLYHLDAQSLWLDEGSTWAVVTGRTGKSWSVLLAELFSPDAAYPLYHLLLRPWVALAGDSEWALRLPSALAGALALPALYLAATELAQPPGAASDRATMAAPKWPGVLSARTALVAPLLLFASPFALWYAQEVKTYSLLLLTTTLQLWALLRALRLSTRPAWLLYLGLATLSFFVHRLALLALAGGALAYLIVWPTLHSADSTALALRSAKRQVTQHAYRRTLFGLGVLLLVAGAIAGTRAAVGNESAGSGGHIAAGPLTALWLTLGRLSLDRGMGTPSAFLALAGDGPEFPRIWLLPTMLLLGWGMLGLLVATRRGDRAALAVLCSGVVPLVLFSISTAFTRLYEPRYMMVVFPAWILTLAYPFLSERLTHRTRWPQKPGLSGDSITLPDDRPAANGYRLAAIGYARRWFKPALLAALLLTHAAALLQPEKGLFSGDPVKEQWRQAIMTLAARVQPDDLVILHPYYVQPLWDYYAPRVTADPLPPPVIFPVFGQGYLNQAPDPERVRREYEPFFDQVAQGRARALLLIAPEHARTIDPPLTLAELQEKARRERWSSLPNQPDEYGWLGLRFAWPQRTWPCGGEKFVGVHLMCQSYPELVGTNTPPAPQVRLEARFGTAIRLRGFTLKPTHSDGAFRPGGTLPVTLFWEASTPPATNYTMFLHLCQDCAAPPAASNDSPPLFGYPPAGQTSTWQVGDPVHDERALVLPADLEPGRYRLLLGVYPAGNPAIEARLAISGAPALSGERLLLAEIEVR